MIEIIFDSSNFSNSELLLINSGTNSFIAYNIALKETPEEELWQGLTLTHLRGKDTLVMAYAFMKENEEMKLKEFIEKNKDIENINTEDIS